MKTIETISNAPFRHLISTIGELPTSFTESMSYYEMLAWLCDFIEKKVVPVVDTNAEALIELRDYVEHYFDNLDVQEEINNKLDAMAESGELEEIIASYINASSILAFDTVALMVSAENLVDGCFVETYGFYTKGDGGGAKYKIREVLNTDTVDNITLIALNDENLVAELILQETMNVRQFGATGDGETDDTAHIQKALDTVGNVTVPDGLYMVNALTNIMMNTNNTLKLSENATLKAITNSSNVYAVIKIDNVDNVKIEGGTIAGERETHTGETGEWGHCISIINGSQNVIIKNIRLIDAWGDGIYVADAKDVHTENVYVNNARRNGYSIIDAVNFRSLNDTIENVHGTNPQSGVDIEPNHEDEKLQNIVFEGTTIKRCRQIGFAMHLFQADATTPEYTIKLNNVHIIGGTGDDSNGGLSINKNQYVKGSIEINNLIVESMYNVSITGKVLYSECPIILNKPVILDYNTHNVSGVATGSAIYFNNDVEDGIDGGNIQIINPSFSSNKTETAPRDIYILGKTTNPMKNISIINPLRIVTPALYLAYCQDVTVVDDKHLLTTEAIGDEIYGTSQSFRYSNTKNYTANRTITLNSNAPTGYEITITRGNQYTPTVTFNNTQKCYPLSADNNPSIALGSVGTTATFRKISATEWTVTNQVGTLTVS